MKWLFPILALSACAPDSLAQPMANAPFDEPSERRAAYLISDLHLGLGQGPDGSWHPTEDFRWRSALQSFLKFVDQDAGGNADLIIVGDFLEMWQTNDQLKCAILSNDLGCTLNEIMAITQAIAQAHSGELNDLAQFAQQNQNRLYVVPGNHDAALTLQRIWDVLSGPLGAESGRVQIVSSGQLYIAPQRLLVEHGHQIGSDVNRYDDWPIVTNNREGKSYLIRPWGENFVQSIFNEIEAKYPIIDNLAPNSAGAKYRFANEGVGRSARDIAKMITFNLFSTSWRQKGDILGKKEGEADWDTTEARKLGTELVVRASGAGDPGVSDLRQDVIAAMNDLIAKDLEEWEIIELCNRAADQDAKRCPTKGAELGALAQGLFRSRKGIMRSHLENRLDETAYKDTRRFVYGHTHAYETPWPLRIPKHGRVVQIANTGAFQRIIDDRDFRAAAKARDLSPKEYFARIGLDELRPCYSYVLVDVRGEMETRWWYADGQGQSRHIGSAVCQFSDDKPAN